ncbi:hypothetical protein E2320_013353, partial [Naja naja]
GASFYPIGLLYDSVFPNRFQFTSLLSPPPFFRKVGIFRSKAGRFYASVAAFWKSRCALETRPCRARYAASVDSSAYSLPKVTAAGAGRRGRGTQTALAGARGRGGGGGGGGGTERPAEGDPGRVGSVPRMEGDP